MHYSVPTPASLHTYTHKHTHIGSGCEIFMVCSITSHYKYLLWFTLLSVFFSLALSLCLFLTLETLDTSICSYQCNHSDFLSLDFREFAFFHFIVIVCPELLLFFHFLCFTIRLLMVFRCCTDSLPACFCMHYVCDCTSYPPGSTYAYISWGYVIGSISPIKYIICNISSCVRVFYVFYYVLRGSVQMLTIWGPGHNDKCFQQWVINYRVEEVFQYHHCLDKPLQGNGHHSNYNSLL